MRAPAFHRVRKRLRKLSEMHAAELLDRVRQETSKHVDSALAHCGYHHHESAAERGAPALGRFFFDSESVPGLLALLNERLPERAEQIIGEATRVCAHRFDLLGYREVDYGAVIDWQCDKVHGKSAPVVPFHRVPYLDYGTAGDPKVTWELNRHQHLVTLAKAYRLTGDERFAVEIDEQWRSWRDANPYPAGINWVSSLEVSFRCQSWLWTYFILSGSAAEQGRFYNEVFDALAVSAHHIERYLSTYSSPNTHLLGEGVGLFFIGALCPQLKSARRWKSVGWSIVQREAQRQIRDDGMHFEQSTYYHVYALDFLLHAMILAERNGMIVPDELERTVSNMLDGLCRLCQSGPPKIGDEDGGRVFDGRRNRAEDLADPLAAGAILFRRADFKSLAGSLREETLWLLGQEGAGVWDDLSSIRPVSESYALRESGLYFMGGADAAQDVVIEAGPRHMLLAGHWHADALSLCMRVNGKAVLIDPGTGAYTGAGAARSVFRGTSAHNTLQIDGADQASADGPFSWAALPNVEVATWITGEHFDLFSGKHDGYQRMEPGAIHRRLVFSLHSELVFVLDALTGEGEHRVDQYWHLGPQLKRAGDGRLLFLGDDGEGLVFVPVDERAGAYEAYDDFWSPVYGRTEPACVVRFGARLCVPDELAIVIVPVNRATHAAMLTRELSLSGPCTGAYRYREGATEHVLVRADGSGRWTAASWASDAEFLCATSVDGTLTRLIVCNGSFAQIGARELFRADHRVACYESRV